jgi:hypothetical protein
MLTTQKAQFLRVQPCAGRSKVLPAADLRLQERGSKPLIRLVINVDPDVPVAGTSTAVSGLQTQDVLQLVRTFDPSATINQAGEIDLDAGATKVSLVRWEATDPPARGLPSQQTLERLVSAALIAAYPARAKAVQDWLDSRPSPPQTDPKEHAWSYMAGWYADQSCEAFYSNLWTDLQVATELESRLRASGAWQIVDGIAS